MEHSQWKESHEQGPGRVKMHMLGTVSQIKDTSEDPLPILKAVPHKKVQWSNMLGKHCVL